MALIRKQRRLLANKNDVNLIERPIKRSAVTLKDIIGNKFQLFHETNHVMKQGSSLIDFDNRYL